MKKIRSCLIKTFNNWKIRRLYKELINLEDGMSKANIEFEIYLRSGGKIIA